MEEILNFDSLNDGYDWPAYLPKVCQNCLCCRKEREVPNFSEMNKVLHKYFLFLNETMTITINL